MLNNSKPPIILVGGVILIRNDKIPLFLRKNTGFMDGYYGLPAGHIKSGEHAIDGVVREAKEEAGVIINKDNLELVHVMHQINGDHERVNFIYATKIWQGEVTHTEPTKSDHFKWFKLSAIPTNTVPQEKNAIEQYVKGSNYSEFDVPDNFIFSST